VSDPCFPDYPTPWQQAIRVDELERENAALRKERDMWKSCAERTDAKMLHEQSDHNKTVERLIVVKAENAALREQLEHAIKAGAKREAELLVMLGKEAQP